MKSIRFLALLLCAALLLPLVPVHAAQSGGSFYLTASTAGQTLIEPVAVPYTAGQTIRDALRGSGYAFGGIDTAFITDIEGVAGNFTVYYDGGAYSLDAIASPETVTAVVFSERERGFPALLDAVTELARFRERTDHVQNYPAAQQAYAAALSGLRTADEAGLGIVQVDVQWVHIVPAGRRQPDHLTVEPLHQRIVFSLRVGDKNIVRRR